MCHPLCATYLNTTNGEKGCAADKRAAVKNTKYTKIIADKGLNLHHLPATAETYGAFGKSTRHLINETIDDTHPDFYNDHNPWSSPDPNRTAYLQIGFALQQGLSDQIRQANKRRRSRQQLGWYAGLRQQYSLASARSRSGQAGGR